MITKVDWQRGCAENAERPGSIVRGVGANKRTVEVRKRRAGGIRNEVRGKSNGVHIVRHNTSEGGRCRQTARALSAKSRPEAKTIDVSDALRDVCADDLSRHWCEAALRSCVVDGSAWHGAELDLMTTKSGKRFGFEFKYSDAPRLTRSMRISIED